MTPPLISTLAFAWIFGGALVGFFLSRRLPRHYLTDESKHVVQLGTGVIGTMAALVLGLLVTSAKGAYDKQGSELIAMSAKLVLLDRALAYYGPEAKDARTRLQADTVEMHDRLWPRDPTHPELTPTSNGTKLFDQIEQLSPRSDAQKDIKARALTLGMELGQARWLIYEQEGVSISAALIAVVVFWLAINFVGLGLFAPRNAAVVATLLLCALSIAVAIFLMLEMFRPFAGLLRLSDAPLRAALEQINH